MKRTTRSVMKGNSGGILSGLWKLFFLLSLFAGSWWVASIQPFDLQRLRSIGFIERTESWLRRELSDRPSSIKRSTEVRHWEDPKNPSVVGIPKTSTPADSAARKSREELGNPPSESDPKRTGSRFPQVQDSPENRIGEALQRTIRSLKQLRSGALGS